MQSTGRWWSGACTRVGAALPATDAVQKKELKIVLGRWWSGACTPVGAASKEDTVQKKEHEMIFLSPPISFPVPISPGACGEGGGGAAQVHGWVALPGPFSCLGASMSLRPPLFLQACAVLCAVGREAVERRLCTGGCLLKAHLFLPLPAPLPALRCSHWPGRSLLAAPPCKPPRHIPLLTGQAAHC